MYIISKFKDYYDSATTTIDKSIVYERKINIFDKTNKNAPKIEQEHLSVLSDDVENYWDYKTSYYFCFHVLFCGKTYHGLLIRKEAKLESGYPRAYETTFYYGKDAEKKLIKHYNEDKPAYWKYGLLDKIKSNKHAIYKFMNFKLNPELHHKLKTPIIFYGDAEAINAKAKRDLEKTKKSGTILVVNPVLKNIEFYKVFDAYTAFQEIQMYVSGVLRSKENDTVEIDNIHKIAQHGYDTKWSFRKEKDTRKRKQKKARKK